MKELQSLLVSGKPLFITIDGFRQAMLTAFPLSGKAPEKPEVKSAFGMTKDEMITYLGSHTWYQLESHLALLDIQKITNQENTAPVTLTDEFSDEQLPDNSIAYHRVFGTVMSDSYYYFSSKQLQSDLLC